MLTSNIDSLCKRFFAIIIIALLYIACDEDPVDPNMFEIKETHITKRKGDSRVVTIDNCDGPERLEQTKEISNTFYAQTEIEAAGGINIDFDVALAEAKAKLEARYRYVNGSARTITSSIKLSAPPYTNVEYTLQSEETWVEGEIYNKETKEIVAKYKILGDTSDLARISSMTKECK